MECQQGFEPIYIANIYHLYTTYILPIGWLFATYHLFSGNQVSLHWSNRCFETAGQVQKTSLTGQRCRHARGEDLE